MGLVVPFRDIEHEHAGEDGGNQDQEDPEALVRSEDEITPRCGEQGGGDHVADGSQHGDAGGYSP